MAMASPPAARFRRPRSNINITYTGAWAKSSDYKDGNGNTWIRRSTRRQNHKLSVAVRDNSNLLVIQGGVQHIPFEGFPNEYMDMIGNDAWFVNTHYEGRFDWGKLDLRAYFQDTRHEMNFIECQGQDATGTRACPWIRTGRTSAIR